MYELRILNGLHRGATLPLDDRTLTLGADEDADVVLVDPGIETQHATLTLTDNGWTLSRQDGVVLGAENNQPQESLNLQPGDMARLGSIWVTVVTEDARWENPPPEPTDVPEEETVVQQAEEEAADLYDPALAQTETAQEEGPIASEDELFSASAEEQAEAVMAEEQAAVEAAPAAPVAKPAKRPGWFSWARSRMVIVPLATVTVLSACAYAITSKDDDASSSALKTRDLNDLPGDAIPEKGKGSKAGKSVTAEAKPKTPALSPQALREAFRARLDEVELLSRFDLQLNDHIWTMRAALDDEEAMRFERVLASFVQEHKITFPINAKIGAAEAMLPFRISQVITGDDASVVTHDGRRLYVGDRYRGVRLVAIQGNQLKFDGERKIQVKW